MKVRLDFELDDKARRALRARVGRDGLATRDEAAMFLATAANTTLGDVVFEYERELADAAHRELEELVGEPVEIDGDGEPPLESSRRPSRRPTRA